MKIRLGFVANSSASSFVLGDLQASRKRLMIVVSIEADIFQQQDQVLSSMEDLNEYRRYEGEMPKWFKEAKSIISKGGCIRLCSAASDEDTVLGPIIHDNGVNCFRNSLPTGVSILEDERD